MAASARAEVRLAFVDIQRALNECAAGKRAKAQLQDRVMQIQDKLRGQQNEVQDLQNELQKKGMLMPADQRQSLSDEYTAKLRDFQQNYKDAQDELRQKDQEVTGAIVRDLATVVRNIGEKGGYTMVMEKGEILWGVPSIDITDEVIRTYDNMHVKAGALADEQEPAPEAAAGGAPDDGSGGLGGSQDSGQFGSSYTSKKRSTISR
jgi:outer membrane protein